MLKKKRKAFSLLELLIVIAIIGALVAILLPNFGNQTAHAQLDACWANIRDINMAVALYQSDNGAFPTCAKFQAGLLGTPTAPSTYFPDGPPQDALIPKSDQTDYLTCYDQTINRCLRDHTLGNSGDSACTTTGGTQLLSAATFTHPGPGTSNFTNANGKGNIPNHAR